MEPAPLFGVEPINNSVKSKFDALGINGSTSKIKEQLLKTESSESL